MATYNVSVTQSIETQPDNVAAGGTMEYVISNPLGVDSYFTLETVPNVNGAYDSTSPKNTSGSYTLGSGLSTLIQNDYFSSVIVAPGGGTLTLVPAVDVTGSTLRLRGVGYTDVTIVPSVDPDAEAFILAAGITDPTQESAINTLVVDLKAYGIWTKMKAIYPMVGGTSTTCKYNLKDPRDLDAAFRIVFSGGWTFSNTGALPNGVNAAGNTFLTQVTSGAYNNTHLSYYSRTNVLDTNIRVEMGAGVGSDFISLYLGLFFSGVRYYGGNCGSKGANITNPANTLGLAINSATSSTLQKIYRNGIEIANSIATQTATPSSAVNIYLGAQGTLGGPSSFSNRECAFASIGDGLTDTDAANLYTAVQAYQTTLGRQV